MTNVLRFRFVAVLFLLVFMHSTLFGQIFRNAPRRVERQSSGVRQTAPATSSPSDAKTQLRRLTEEIKESPRKISESDLSRSQKLLLDAVNNLQRRLPREFDRATANDWSATFRLAELKATLGQKTPDTEIREAVQSVFLSDKEGVRWVIFDGLQTALRRYQTVANALEDNSYESRLIRICDNLVNYIEEYGKGHNPLYFVTLSEATAWLDDISIIEPRAARLAELTRIACSGVNVQLQIGSDFATAGFERDIEEERDVNEVILGTKVVGEGMLTGKSSAELVSSPNRATIKVLADAEIETNTDGSQKMVTLKNHTTGTLQGEKQILFTAEGITTTPAKARANLNAKISDVRINAGPIIKMVARGQIDSRKEDSQAEAARRAERRMSIQMNDRVDPNIAELNEKYQKIRDALNKTGLFPRVWNLSSTSQQIDWAILLGNKYQPSAPIPAPALKTANGLAVQVHQSALNNMLAIALAGRSIDEERFSQRMGEFFDETPEFLKRKSGETPAKVSFGPRAPVDVLFIDNKIRVVVRINDIQVMDNVGRAFTISVEYQIKEENRKIVLEQTEAEAFPAGFNPNSGTTLSATQTMIRSYLLRRLEALQKRYEMEPLEPGGEWTGKGQLTPKFASTEKGWLSFVWSWD
jgi:hypothetical protein